MSRISAVFQRHKKLLSLLGALLVFVTFVVNDWWKERVKSQRDVIDSAENGYRSAEEFASVRKQIVDLEYQVEDLQVAARHQSVLAESSVITNIDARNLTDKIRIAMDRLNDQLPNNEKAKESLQERRTKLEALDVELRQLLLLAMSEKRREDPRLSTELREMKNQVWKQYWIMFPLGTELIADAEALKAEREQKLRVVNSISYALYLLGWGLGVAGQLLGTELEAGG